MSTLASAQFDSSDDEADADFVPAGPKPRGKRSAKRKAGAGAHASGGESESSGSSDEDGEDEVEESEAKRLRLDQEAAEQEERRRKAREAFAAFNEPPSEKEQCAVDTNGAGVIGAEKRMVQVKRARQFAGETIHETVSLPADHPDAIAYLARLTSAASASGTGTIAADAVSTADASGSSENSGVAVAGTAEGGSAVPPARHPSPLARAQSTGSSFAPLDPSASTSSSRAAPAPASAPASAPTPTHPPKRAPPKRKPRQSLEAMSAALDKGKKMTTLEKSQLDWKSHTASTAGMSDELASNRRAGGYLEKRDFLERVDDRRGGAFDSQRKGR